jgi:hypothetical protein
MITHIQMGVPTLMPIFTMDLIMLENWQKFVARFL